ncbi:MAG TPA: hypothetical protein VGE39_03350 [Prosthecobacter sp.]
MEEEFNPYAAPKAEVIQQHTEAESIRREFIRHETSIRSLGCLYWLAAVVFSSVLVVGLVNVQSMPLRHLAYMLVQAVLAAAIGRGLRTLQRWAGILAALWACVGMALGLASLPFGAISMVISAYIIFLMVGTKGRRVLTPEYRAIVLETPHVKPRTSVVVWVLLALLLAFLAAAILAALWG